MLFPYLATTTLLRYFYLHAGTSILFLILYILLLFLIHILRLYLQLLFLILYIQLLFLILYIQLLFLILYIQLLFFILYILLLFFILYILLLFFILYILLLFFILIPGTLSSTLILLLIWTILKPIVSYFSFSVLMEDGSGLIENPAKSYCSKRSLLFLVTTPSNKYLEKLYTNKRFFFTLLIIGTLFKYLKNDIC